MISSLCFSEEWYHVGDMIFAHKDQYGNNLNRPNLYLVDGYFIGRYVYISSIIPDGDTGYYILELAQIADPYNQYFLIPTRYRIKKGSILHFFIKNNNNDDDRPWESFEEKYFLVEDFSENMISLTECVGYK